MVQTVAESASGKNDDDWKDSSHARRTVAGGTASPSLRLTASCWVTCRSRARYSAVRARTTERMAPDHVRVCSESADIESRHVTLGVPWRLVVAGPSGTVIDRASTAFDRPVSAAVLRAVRRAAQRGARVASICSGAFGWRRPACSRASAPPRTGVRPAISRGAIPTSRSTRMSSTWITVV